ncbi:hypothetical protein QFC22_003717 [Naganishia vaughanmartiniae]|uniref:Uncharacterized protein n=1 Tax=Naganishia vaughanmartiniae TaxID=1424756 RepID=A0ACC2X6J7_9TREE|nr:hypothetical protein QFC22_003717 [Naganishia vaughanmartiniae]
MLDEGIYNQDGEMVSKVIGQALQEVRMSGDFAFNSSRLIHSEQSFEYHLDIATDPDPTTTLGLAKLVSSAFFVHKSHFRLERRLPSENVVDFHEDGIAWCIRKYTALNKSEKNVKDKTTKDRLRKREHACLSYFKILTLLTPALGGRDALKV